MQFWVTNIIQNNQTASYLMNEARICNESEFYYSLDLDLMSMAYKHNERHVIKPTFLSGLMTSCTHLQYILHYICCYYVSFGLLMQIFLADYPAYLHELQVNCTLSSMPV